MSRGYQHGGSWVMLETYKFIYQTIKLLSKVFFMFSSSSTKTHFSSPLSSQLLSLANISWTASYTYHRHSPLHYFTKGQSKFIIMSSGYVFVLFLAGVNLFAVVVVGCKGYPLLCVNNVHINITTRRHEGHVMFS